MSDVNFLSASDYASGKSPLDVAEQHVALLVEVWLNILRREAKGLPPLPAWQDTGFDAVARKILGDLLDAGWRLPSEETVRAAAEHSRASKARYDAWWASLTETQRASFLDHYNRTGEPPPDLRPPS